jgi:crotonobetainyl-CoA:carnitine CoA-transferase CaiB-like acyl-CoA transferase
MGSPEGSNGDKKSGALFDLKVIDLGHYIAGPYCASLFAGLGAEVIKVERPGSGDGARSMGPFPGDEPHLENSGLFNYLNQGKKGITLNLKSEAGRNAFRKLVADADVLIENFEPRVMPSLGLAYDDLRELNPSLVMTSISNFGQSGPYRDYKGYEITVSALGGIQAEIGEPDREPIKLGGSQLQFQAGLTAAFATMSAVCYRDVTGIGQHVDLAIVEVAATLKGAPIMIYQEMGYHRIRNGARISRTQPVAAHDVSPQDRHIAGPCIVILPCKDGYVCVDAELPQQWLALCDMIGRPELKEDPRFSWATHHEHADELDAILIDYLKTKTLRELFEEATAWRVPSAVVNNMAQLFHDPQHRARGFFVQVDHPVLGKMEYPGHPFVMSVTPWQQVSGAPLLGEHNRVILRERLGYSEQELATMTKDGVI